jgi:hypothetical protein
VSAPLNAKVARAPKNTVVSQHGLPKGFSKACCAPNTIESHRMDRCVGVQRLTRACITAVAAATVVFALSVPAAAQGTSSFFGGITLSGYVDTYYAYNFNHPATPCRVVNGVTVFNCLRAFDVARSSFSLNLAALALEKVPTGDSRGGFRIDLGYGSGAELIAGAESSRPTLSQNVLQAYASYLAAADGRLQFDVGKFVTPAGIERIDPAGNWNASRSLLFALAIPRDHVGLRAVYTPNGTITMTGLLSNGWSDVAENAGAKLVGALVSVRPARRLTLTETYLGGPETSIGTEGWRELSDTAVVGRLTSRLALAFNADLGNDRRTRQSWQGAAAYMRYQTRDWFAITSRIESLRDHDGFMTGVSQDLQEATVTAEFRPAPASVLRLEYRIDVADRPYFLQGVSTTVKTQSILLADWVFLFSSHQLSSPQQGGPFSVLRKK